LLKRLVIGGTTLAVLAAVAWLAWAQITQRVVTGWLDARADEGWFVAYDSVDVTGFPTRFRTELSDLELADPVSNVVWTLPDLTLESRTFRPDHVRAIWPTQQVLSSPVERLTIAAATLTSELDVQPASDFALDASDTILRDVSVTSDAGWRMALPEGRLTMTRTAGSAAQYDVAFTASNLEPPASARAQLDPRGILPQAIETLVYTATMEFDRPWDLRAIEERRPQITALDLRELNATWGGLILRAAGELTVDEAGIPEGAIAVRAENWREMVALAVRAGVLAEPLQGTVEGLLGVVAGFSGDPEVIDADLSFSNGRAFLGPLPIGPAPVLLLR
jgi:hypothetical protein